MENDNLKTEQAKDNIVLSDVMRSFSVGDLVEYRPYENCSKKDISGIGKISEVLGDGYYRAMFGDYERKNNWWSNGKYHWSNLWEGKKNYT